MLTTAIPASIVAIVIATALATWGNFTTATIGALPNSLPSPEFPAMDVNVLVALAPSVLAVATLAAIESLLSARVASTLSGNTAYQPDRELFGQGLASVIAGLFGGMPATGAIARTAVNVKSGARTRLASITHGIVLLAVIYWGTTLVANIPVAALAGVLMVTAIRMIPVQAAKDIFRSTRSDATVFIATAVVTISFDLIEAVAIGILATAFFALRSMVASSGIHREEIPAPHTDADQHVALFRLDGALFFGAAESMLSRLSTLDDVRVVILRMAGLQFLDATGAHVLVDISTALENRGIHVILKGIRVEHRGLISRMGLPDSVDVVDSLDDALALARRRATGI
jgi:SulP family sulfate permease